MFSRCRGHRASLCSTGRPRFCVAVAACTVVIRPRLMPQLSLSTLATGPGGWWCTKRWRRWPGRRIFVVHAKDEHGGVVLGRADISTFLAPASRCFCGVALSRNRPVASITTSAPDFVPLQVGGVALLRQADLLAVDDQGVALDGHGALERPCTHVVLEHVRQVVGFEQVVDANDLDVEKFCTAARNTIRPMRPKPLMPTLIAISVSSGVTKTTDNKSAARSLRFFCCLSAAHGGGDVLGVNQSA